MIRTSEGHPTNQTPSLPKPVRSAGGIWRFPPASSKHPAKSPSASVRDIPEDGRSGTFSTSASAGFGQPTPELRKSRQQPAWPRPRSRNDSCAFLSWGPRRPQKLAAVEEMAHDRTHPDHRPVSQLGRLRLLSCEQEVCGRLWAPLRPGDSGVVGLRPGISVWAYDTGAPF